MPHLGEKLQTSWQVKKRRIMIIIAMIGSQKPKKEES